MSLRFYTASMKLKNYCVDNSLYTNGTNVEYSEMFEQFDKIRLMSDFNQVSIQLEKVAYDILNHTPEDSWLLTDSDITENAKEIMTDIFSFNIVEIIFM